LPHLVNVVFAEGVDVRPGSRVKSATFNNGQVELNLQGGQKVCGGHQAYPNQKSTLLHRNLSMIYSLLSIHKRDTHSFDFTKVGPI
jgi:hypothetical protein